MATAKKTPKPSTSRALVPWEAEMAAAAQKAAKAEKPVGLFKSISTKGGFLMIDEQPVPGNEIDVVVIGAVHENQYFDGPYDPNTPQTPVCYAFSDPDLDEPEDAMAPHEKARDKQGDDNGLCANCWANQMASAQQGQGKACKNVRRLAVVTSDSIESAEALDAAEVRVLKVPVMSVKGWAAYLRTKLAEEIQRPYWGVVTRIKLVPDPKSQFRVTFSFVELVNFDQELYDAMQRRTKEAVANLSAPYPEIDAEAAAPAPRGGRGVPMKPVGRAAQAMQRRAPAPAPAAKKAAPANKRAKY